MPKKSAALNQRLQKTFEYQDIAYSPSHKLRMKT